MSASVRSLALGVILAVVAALIGPARWSPVFSLEHPQANRAAYASPLAGLNGWGGRMLPQRASSPERLSERLNAPRRLALSLRAASWSAGVQAVAPDSDESTHFPPLPGAWVDARRSEATLRAWPPTLIAWDMKYREIRRTDFLIESQRARGPPAERHTPPVA